MNANTYQQKALGTARTLDNDQRLVNAALGAAGESGEICDRLHASIFGDPLVERLLALASTCGQLADQVKKARFQGHDLNYALADRLTVAIKQMADQVQGALANEATDGTPGPLHLAGYDADKIGEELGDLIWYVALGADASSHLLSEVMIGNLDKLARRYPGGFAPERSRGRE